jgi:glycosyltransferase involved in cell wall biosynthesis
MEQPLLPKPGANRKISKPGNYAKRAAVVLHTYFLGISVIIVETIKALEKAGFEVDIFIGEHSYAMSPAVFPSKNIHLVTITQKKNEEIEGARAGWLKKFKLLFFAIQYWWLPWLGWRGDLNEYGYSYERRYGAFVDGMGERFQKCQYSIIIGMESSGLIAAALARKRWQPETPLIYYNLELLQHQLEARPNRHITKHFETLCVQDCRFTVIADEHRGRVFRRVNRLPECTMRYLPVCTEGEPVKTKGTLFHKQFQLSPEARIVLYAGNIYSPWALTEEIVQSVGDWPTQYVLVLHTWLMDTEDNPCFRKIKAMADARRVFFSTQPVPPEEVPELMSSADVGLAFYQPLDENFTEIGASSNKLAQYARAGLPVIASNFPSIARVLERFHSGICVDQPAGIGAALKAILEGYDGFRRGAFESYENNYRFSAKFKPLLEEIESLCKEQQEPTA